MDAWVQLKKNLSYDKDGAWAVTGKVNAPLLKHLLADPYFRLVPPKSTGREYFNVSWLQQHLDTQRQTIADQDIQATLLALTAYSVCNTLLSLPHQPKHIYVCGGGAHNKALMASLRTYLDDSPLNKTILGDTQILGIHPDDIEACLFAWLAKQHIESQAIDLRSVTGASTVNMLGKLTI